MRRNAKALTNHKMRFSKKLCITLLGLYGFAFASSVQAMVVPIPTEEVTWQIEGTVGELQTFFGPPFPVEAETPFQLTLGFQLDSLFVQCPTRCEGNGDTRWNGTITDFSLLIAGILFEADIGLRFPNFVRFIPGDEETDVDYISMRLGNRRYPGAQEPVPLVYSGGVLGAAFSFYMADFTGGLFDEDDKPWLRPLTLPTRRSFSTDTSLFVDERPTNSNTIGRGAILDFEFSSVTPVPTPNSIFLVVAGLLCLMRRVSPTTK